MVAGLGPARFPTRLERVVVGAAPGAFEVAVPVAQDDPPGEFVPVDWEKL